MPSQPEEGWVGISMPGSRSEGSGVDEGIVGVVSGSSESPSAPALVKAKVRANNNPAVKTIRNF